MFRKIVIVVGVLLAALLLFAATRPDTFNIERTASIKAPPEKIFPLIEDFHRWGAWSPYEKLDPTMQRTYSGPASGVGAVYEWQGSSAAGAGRMEITQSSPSLIVIKLDFTKPMKSSNTVEYTLVPNGDTTTVTWAMHGASPFISRLMQVFFNMDKLVGKDLETGLATLKSVAEA